MLSPDFVALAAAYGIAGERVTCRDEVRAAVERARGKGAAMLLDFRVEKEEAVFPMVPSGADLHRMIRRPQWEAPVPELPIAVEPPPAPAAPLNEVAP
jgi:acetolactate synthase I/II/III large subunit